MLWDGDYVKVLRPGFENTTGKVVSVLDPDPGSDWFWVVVEVSGFRFLLTNFDIKKIYGGDLVCA